MPYLTIAGVLGATSIGHANGRPPATTSVFFRPGDNQAIYLSSTFGLFISPDGCQFHWICEDDIGFGGEFDPAYAVTPTGAILATTFHGLRASHDGGCTFTTPTDQLAATDPGNISTFYLDALEVGPAGDVWVGTSNTGPNNAVYHSTDDAVSFAAAGSLPSTMWFESVKVAPSDPMRIYVTAFQVSGSAMPPSAHFFRSIDGGVTWMEQPLTNVMLGNQPIIVAKAVDASNADILYAVSQMASPPNGDVLYRSGDGGATFMAVLTTTYPITGVVARDPTTIVVATQFGGAFESADGGLTFAALPNPPQLACLGQRGDGVLFGCAANYDPDHMALGRSTDATTWQPVISFQYLSGPLTCPTGTAEHDTCAPMWPMVSQQLGVVASVCGAGPDGIIDAPGAAVTPLPPPGCCGTGAGATTPIVLVMIGGVISRLRSRIKRRNKT